jgi:hypothetical protein
VDVMALLPVVARADDWAAIKSGDAKNWEVDPSTIQQGTRANNVAKSPGEPVISVWVRLAGSWRTEQIWIDCRSRESQTFTPDDQITRLPGGWTAWAPIPPETREWAVWEYLCKKGE